MAAMAVGAVAVLRYLDGGARQQDASNEGANAWWRMLAAAVAGSRHANIVIVVCFSVSFVE